MGTNVDLESLIVRRILSLEDEVATLENQATRIQRRADAWKRSRWGQVGALAAQRPRRTIPQKVRLSLDAVRTLLWPATGDSTSAGPVEEVPARKPETTLGSSADGDRGAAERGANLAAAVTAGRKLIVAAVMDPFTRRDFDPECMIVDLHPDQWQSELEGAQPDLLFIESAWRGDREAWYDTIQHRPQELVDIVEWCRSNGVPTVFWNKEDPVYFDRFIKVADLFDHVFTTDLDSVPRYVQHLGHNRVHVLPFAAQPLHCNPIETGERKPAAVFAGSYYEGFKRRNQELFAQIDGALRVLPVEIYDRNFRTDNKSLQWPDPYARLVVGTLPPEQIEIAYKGYRIALNVNTVTDSQTMVARRAFDLMASGTPTISNPTRSTRVLFGDLIHASDSADGIEAAVRSIVNDPDTTDKRRAMGLRHILRNHTYAERFRRVVQVVSSVEPPDPQTTVGLLASAEHPDHVQRWHVLAAGQLRARVQLVIVSDDPDTAQVCAALGVPCLTTESARGVVVNEVFGDADLIAVLSADHWYGPHYLDGLLAASTYSTAPVLAKTSRFRMGAEAVIVDEGQDYRWWEGGPVPWHRAAVRSQHCDAFSLAALVEQDALVPGGLATLGIDRFDYCDDAGGLAELQTLSAGLPIRTGAPIEDVIAGEPARSGMEVPYPAYPSTVVGPGGGCIVHQTDDGVVVGWSYQGNKPVYLPFAEEFPIMAEGDSTFLRLRVDGSGNLGVNVSWAGPNRRKIPGVSYYGNSMHRIEVPEGAERVILSLALRDSGTKLIRSISLSSGDLQPSTIVQGWAARTLVLTDHYPSYDDLYRNGFVHTRVRGYRARGVDPDVYLLRPGVTVSHREFHGVQVMTGGPDGLRSLLRSGHYENVLVHFLSRGMWDVLRDLRGKINIVIWIHGFEIEPWWRRTFNYRDDIELARAKQQAELRMELWREVSTSDPEEVRFVFVSQAFRDEVIEDQQEFGFRLDDQAVRIMPNPVDEDIFSYVPKPPEQRKKILLIRPFASRKYANDLAAAAIVKLASEPWFGELSFRIVGDGPLFEEDTQNLAGYPNVTIERTFLTHSRIAALHKDYGVFLVPTRRDAQGVSRDEAMSSGLVPVTSDVPAIHEFVGLDEGYIAPYDDSDGLAEAIRELYHNPEIFLAKSEAAAARVRRTVASSVIISRELELLKTAASGHDPIATSSRLGKDQR